VKTAGQESVLVCTRGMPAPLVSEVAKACSLGGYTFASWQGEGSELPGGAPSLLVAGIAPGERHIREELMETVTRAYPGLPLLLLSGEPLVRPSMSLQEGRVNLLGPPLSHSKISARIRALLNDGAPTQNRHMTLPLGIERPNTLVFTHAEERTRFWIGTIACGGAAAAQTPAFVPRLHQIARTGLAALVPLSERESPPSTWTTARLAELSSALDERLREEEYRRAIETICGEATGVVHLSASATEWRIFWPRAHAPLELLSPLRLPTRWLFRPNPKGGPRHVRAAAASGDVLVAFSSRPAELERVPPFAQTPSSLRDMASGGSALLHGIEATLRDKPAAISGVVLEVL
jgi:hypothetical protein